MREKAVILQGGKIGQDVGGNGDVRVYHGHHACLAMVALRAVVVKGFSVVDCDDEGGRGFVCFGGDVAGVEAVLEGDAGGFGVALDDGVVLLYPSLVIRSCGCSHHAMGGMLEVRMWDWGAQG